MIKKIKNIRKKNFLHLFNTLLSISLAFFFNESNRKALSISLELSIFETSLSFFNKFLKSLLIPSLMSNSLNNLIRILSGQIFSINLINTF